MSVVRYTKGWMVKDMFGRIIAGPYYSLSYAEERDRELASAKRREKRQSKRRDR